MFMKNVMTEIWKDKSKEYQKAYQTASTMKLRDLVMRARELSTGMRYEYPHCGMNMIPTIGCPYKRDSKGVYSGCSMCDYHSDYVEGEALMTAMREKDVNSYAAFMRESLDRITLAYSPKNCELFSIYSGLNKMEMPNESITAVFCDVQQKFPQADNYVLEVRAEDINPDSVEELLKYTGDVNLEFEVGVEATEWIRNHWINKGLNDDKLANAIEVAHHYGIEISTNVLLGIPGLTEMQSIDTCIETVKLVSELNTDRIIVMPTNRKKYSFQGHLYDMHRENSTLADIGIAQGEHTGLGYLFSVLDGLKRIALEIPEAKEKITLSQINADTNSIENTVPYNGEGCKCSDDIRKRLAKQISDVDFNEITTIDIENIDHECRAEYEEILHTQSKAGSIKETLQVVANEVSNGLWDTKRTAKKIAGFAEELKSL